MQKAIFYLSDTSIRIFYCDFQLFFFSNITKLPKVTHPARFVIVFL